MHPAQEALINAMVIAAAADGDVSEQELATISRLVQTLPAFQGVTFDDIPSVADSCVRGLSETDGLDRTLACITEALPTRLRETAYALAAEVIAADLRASQEELRLLQLLEDRFRLDRLVTSAIERGLAARMRKVDIV